MSPAGIAEGPTEASFTEYRFTWVPVDDRCRFLPFLEQLRAYLE